MDVRRSWRDLRLRRPAFELHRPPDEPVWYRGRPFPLEKLPIDDALRRRVDEVLAAHNVDAAAIVAVAHELADAMRAPVVWDDEVYRPAPLP